MPNIYCDLCNKIMDLTRPHYHEESGWVKTRRLGGTNALSIRKRTGKYAHWECVELKKSKVSPDQRRMF